MTPASSRGRRPGDPEVTRRAILAAAKDRFGAVGYDKTTIRAVAAAASVDPALVHHHFGSKASLFAAAHELPDPRGALEPIFTGPRDEMGERLARIYLTMMSAPNSPALSLLRAAATNDDAARMMRAFLEKGLLSVAERLLDADRPRLRLALCASHLVGLAVGRSLIEIRELGDPSIEELVALVAPTLQRYLTGDLPPPA